MTDWSTLKKLIWLRIIKGGGSALRTVTGAIVHVTNALAMPAEALSVNVEPIQDLHGYDSPWPAGGGKNLLDPDERTNNTQNIYFYQANGFLLKENQTYTFSVYSSENAAGLYIHKLSDNSNLAVKYNSKTVTYTPTEDVLAWFDAYYSPSPTGGTANINVQLELGSTATAWTPYSNICPISGRTSATVTRTGKNLLKLSDWETESDSGITIGTDNISIINKGYQENLNRYNVLNRSACVFSFHVKTIAMSDSRAMFAVYADGTTKLTGIGTVSTGNITLDSVGTEKDITITVPNGKEYISFGGWAWGGEVQISNLQLELGSTASAYEPYRGNTYTIQLGDTVYGGTLDVTQGKMVVDRAMWTKNTATMNNSEDYPGWRDAGIREIVGTGVSKTYSDMYLNIGTKFSVNTLGLSNDIVYLGIGDYGKNQTEWQALAIDVQIVIPLATPFEITLTPTQIEMLLGENNLWADAGDSTLTYYAEGEASTSEALGILLGGTDNNHGGADDVSDDEALGILLGGS